MPKAKIEAIDKAKKIKKPPHTYKRARARAHT
jgi:hypothetical protein